MEILIVPEGKVSEINDCNGHNECRDNVCKLNQCIAKSCSNYCVGQLCSPTKLEPWQSENSN